VTKTVRKSKKGDMLTVSGQMDYVITTATNTEGAKIVSGKFTTGALLFTNVPPLN
jgi:hypothetical protein